MEGCFPQKMTICIYKAEQIMPLRLLNMVVLCIQLTETLHSRLEYYTKSKKTKTKHNNRNPP